MKSAVSGLASVSKVLEVCRDVEIATADELNHGLKLIFLFSGHANLSILQLALNFEVLRFDRLNDFLGFIALQALLDLEFLPRVTD